MKFDPRFTPQIVHIAAQSSHRTKVPIKFAIVQGAKQLSNRNVFLNILAHFPMSVQHPLIKTDLLDSITCLLHHNLFLRRQILLA